MLLPIIPKEDCSTKGGMRKSDRKKLEDKKKKITETKEIVRIIKGEKYLYLIYWDKMQHKQRQKCLGKIKSVNHIKQFSATEVVSRLKPITPADHCLKPITKYQQKEIQIMPRQMITTHILIRCNKEIVNNSNMLYDEIDIDDCVINVEGNLSNDLMVKLIDFFMRKINK